MADYTRLNIKEDVEDQAPKFGLSPQLEYRVGREPLELENSGVSYLRMGPGFRMPFGHHHGKQEEVYVLLSGSARLKLDDEVIDLQPFDTVRIAKDTMRNLEGGPDGAELILIGAPKTGPGDAEMEQGWWND
jgi:mannose-6-phosphate isomerase-like protein (cupin superfamily)